jgi:hypothetical protein
MVRKAIASSVKLRILYVENHPSLTEPELVLIRARPQPPVGLG